MDALREEARTGIPTKNRWHYKKVWDYERDLQKWVDLVCSSPRFAAACRGGNGAALNADLGIAAAILADMWEALKTWEDSPYHTGTPGQNPPLPTSPITSAPPLPAPSRGMPAQPAVPPPGGIQAQPGSPSPVPGIEPTDFGRGMWQYKNVPTGDLPADMPGIAPTTVPTVAPTSGSPDWGTALKIEGLVLVSAAAVVLVVATAPAWVPAALVGAGVAAVVVGVGVTAASATSNPHAMAA